MKKTFFSIFYMSLLALLLIGCNSNSNNNSNSPNSIMNNITHNESTPNQAVSDFLDAAKQQNYAHAKTYYSENLDNMAQFKNQVEDISPTVANKFFDKISDFSYEIHDTSISSDDPNKATVTATIQAYDLGKSFEATVLDYIKTDLEMTFDGAKNDEIIKQVEETLVKDIESSEKTFRTDVTISLSKENDTWKLDKISDNPALLNALSGNIIATIDKLSNHLNSIS